MQRLIVKLSWHCLDSRLVQGEESACTMQRTMLMSTDELLFLQPHLSSPPHCCRLLINNPLASRRPPRDSEPECKNKQSNLPTWRTNSSTGSQNQQLLSISSIYLTL